MLKIEKFTDVCMIGGGGGGGYELYPQQSYKRL